MPKLLYLVTEDWYFCSHRLPLAIAAREAGYEVTVAVRVNEHGEQIRAAGLNLVPIKLARESTNPLRETLAFLEILKLYRRIRPDIAHHVAVKPIIYGTIAARLTGVRLVVNAIAGLGYVFSSKELKARVLRPMVLEAYRRLVAGNKGHVIVQNEENKRLLIDMGIASESQISLIRGAGVNMSEFIASQEPPGEVIVALPSRMLREKGVHEFVNAARQFKSQGVSTRFVLVGKPDEHNPTSIAESELRQWDKEGIVEWWGWRGDMATVLRGVNIVCLPSAYGEGVPKVLIEAAACGRPIVTTDLPGCRDIVQNGINGFLVPPKDPHRLFEALSRLISDSELRRAMGANGRARAEREFSIEKVTRETLNVYSIALGSRP